MNKVSHMKVGILKVCHVKGRRNIPSPSAFPTTLSKPTPRKSS